MKTKQEELVLTEGERALILKRREEQLLAQNKRMNKVALIPLPW